MKFSDRDLEITRRRETGERPVDLARVYGISAERVWQIVTAVQRHQRGEPPKQRRRHATGIGAPARSLVRPRLRKAASGLWECTDGVVARAARTVQGAYQRWLTAAVADAMERRPVCAPVEPTPARAPRRTPRQKAPPSTSRPAVGETEPEAAFTGEVQVLRGTPARPPLQFAASLGLTRDKLARVQAAQPPMRSLAGARQE